MAKKKAMSSKKRGKLEKKLVEDKTFGMKNKKGGKAKKYMEMVKAQAAQRVGRAGVRLLFLLTSLSLSLSHVLVARKCMYVCMGVSDCVYLGSETTKKFSKSNRCLRPPRHCREREPPR